MQNCVNKKSPESRLATRPNFSLHGHVQYCQFGAKPPELVTPNQTQKLGSTLRIGLQPQTRMPERLVSLCRPQSALVDRTV